MSNATSSEIARSISAELEQAGRVGHEQAVAILNRATEHDWSSSIERQSSEGRGLEELARRVMTLGEDPDVTVTVTLTIHAADHPITRSGTASGPSYRTGGLEHEALVNAVLSFR